MPRTAKKSGPVHEIRLGRIRAAIWANDTQNGTRHNVTVTRLFKDGDEWKDSSSFGRDDLPLVAKVLDRCHSWIFEESAAAATKANGNGDGRDGEDTPF
ncbi:MAG: hypothetical protein MPJ50_11940 [Pirellulales bacterium]|nr:hypothetical protein [Pirellulales bacterium]